MILPGFEISPGFNPRTKDEALMLGQAWGRSLSHLNEFMAVEPGPEHRQETLVYVLQADAAEVERLAGLWAMLPDGDDQMLLRALAEHEEAERERAVWAAVEEEGP